MRIALATCSTLPSHEHDDEPLHAALRAHEVGVEQPIWDDPRVDWSSYDAVLIRTTWDYQDKHSAFVSWAERVAGQTRLFNPAGIVRWNTHKLYLRELEALGVPLAETVWFEAGRSHDLDLARVVRERGIARGFLKPALGANARHTLRFDARREAELEAAAEQLKRLIGGVDMMLQPYLASVEGEGELSAIYFDDRLSHAVRKVPRAGDYRVQDDYGARDAPVELDDEARELSERTLAAVRELARRQGWGIELPLLYARVDLLRDDRGALVLNELELVEPSLFFRHGPRAAEQLTAALLRRLG